jgi:hypothetical protein
VTTTGAALLAMTLNVVTLIVLALWLHVPWARDRDIDQAPTPLAVIHIGRTVALQADRATPSRMQSAHGHRSTQ